jgi:cytochrome c5
MLFSLSIVMAFPLSCAQADERSGKDIVDAVCAECHTTGVDNAPKIGDRQAWSSRASQGLSTLTVHAIEGIRNMPAHGGDPKLSDLEIARAITYMVNQSGGDWVEPASAQDLATERSGAQVVGTECAKCHAAGVGGAPRIGATQAWVQRMKRGLPYLVASAIHGHAGMPPRGGQANLTDTELRSAILYMYDPASAVAKPPAGVVEPPPAEDANPNHRVVDGVEIYLGIMAAESMRALPKGSPELSMHGGIPKGSGYFHLNVSLFDQESQAPINDAQIQMEFRTPGLRSTRIALEPMLAGSGSYGIYVKPQPGHRYLITLHIKKPPETRIVEATFEHEFFPK